MSSRDRLSVWGRIWTHMRHLIGVWGTGVEALLLAAGRVIALEADWDYRCLDDLDC